jgi:hypothetical protein
MGRRLTTPTRKRPMPPQHLLADPTAPLAFAPAPEVLDWLTETILLDTGVIHNPDHGHLLSADLRVLWASGPSRSKGRAVIGTAEEVLFRCSLWQKARQEEQMRAWFGYVPDWLITLDASYCAQCDDAAFCALVEHELYHIAHEKDLFGAPAFTKDGQPKIKLVGHDVEEFVGVVRRYGAPDGGNLAKLIRAAQQSPEVAPISLIHACGACLRVA